MKTLTEIQKAYIAGIVDGEGCLNLQRTKSPHKSWEYNFYIRLLVTNSNLNLIYWLQEITGVGSVYRYEKGWNKTWKPIHRWQVVHNEAIELINIIKPYCIVKKEIVDIIQQFPVHGKGGSPRTKEVYERQNYIWGLAKQSNKRGVLLPKEVIIQTWDCMDIMKHKKSIEEIMIKIMKKKKGDIE